MNTQRSTRGFTLIEMIVVITIGAVISTTLLMFFKPAFDGFLASRARADLTDQADTALRRMVRDVRAAVPNSIRMVGTQCFELIPTSGGGRFRSGPDTVNDAAASCTPGAACAAPLDSSRATTEFDVLTPYASVPAVGDWVVIGNQSPADVYGGSNRAAVSAISQAYPAYGRYRLTVAGTQFPVGYDGGRFSVVPDSQRAVFYVCAGADGALNARGDGKGTLFRLQNYGFDAAYPGACPATVTADVLATRVRSCSFIHDPNQGATQQSGFVWIELDLARNGEAAHFAIGAHVANGP